MLIFVFKVGSSHHADYLPTAELMFVRNGFIEVTAEITRSRPTENIFFNEKDV